MNSQDSEETQHKQNKKHTKTSSLANLSSIASPLSIPASDIIKLIEQFLSEQGLYRSLHILQEESQITTNTVESITHFKTSFEQGHWDIVLRTLNSFRIPQNKVGLLYEHIILELCELGEFNTAQTLFQNHPIFTQFLQTHNKIRYEQLQTYIIHTIRDSNELYGNTSREIRRQHLASIFVLEVIQVPPHRLLYLLTNALRYQQYVGLLPQYVKDYNIFTGTISQHSIEAQRAVNELYTIITCDIYNNEQDYIQCSQFTHNGKYLITGSQKGFIELWNIDDGCRTNDLQYQRDGNIMMHTTSISSLAISHDDEVLVSCTSSGEMKLWNILTGECIMRFGHAHSNAITHVQFANNALLLITAGLDNIVKVWNLQQQTSLYTYTIENSISYICFPSSNLRELTSHDVMIIDQLGYMYLYRDNDLIIQKHLYITNNRIENIAANLSAVAASGAASGASGSGTTSSSTSSLAALTATAPTSVPTTNPQTFLTVSSGTSMTIRPDIILLCTQNDYGICSLDDRNGQILQSYNLLQQDPERLLKRYKQHKKQEVINAIRLNNISTTLVNLNPAEFIAKVNALTIDSDDFKKWFTNIAKTMFLLTTTSALGKYVYTISETGDLLAFQFEGRQLEGILTPHNGSIVTTMCHHPYRNVLVTTSIDGNIHVWR